MTSIVRHGPPPRYYQLREIIREMVRLWHVVARRADPVRARAERAASWISRMTVRQSVSELVKEGLLSTVSRAAARSSADQRSPSSSYA